MIHKLLLAISIFLSSTLLFTACSSKNKEEIVKKRTFEQKQNEQKAFNDLNKELNKK